MKQAPIHLNKPKGIPDMNMLLRVNKGGPGQTYGAMYVRRADCELNSQGRCNFIPNMST